MCVFLIPEPGPFGAGSDPDPFWAGSLGLSRIRLKFQLFLQPCFNGSLVEGGLSRLALDGGVRLGLCRPGKIRSCPGTGGGGSAVFIFV